MPHTSNSPSVYLRLAEAHLSHDRTSFKVGLICDDENCVRVPVQVAVESIPLLVPYLVLLRDSSMHPSHTELPVVPVSRGDSGSWTFDHAAAMQDQEPIPPALDAPPPPLF